VPLPHVLQGVAALRSVSACPAVQKSHLIEPLPAYCPAAHTSHALMLVPPPVGTKRPAEHAMHAPAWATSA
jgi:hypothetical protein